MSLLWTLFAWMLACGTSTPVATAPASADTTIDARLTVHAPVVVGGLAVFLVTDKEAGERPDGDYALLATALGDGTLKITEVDEGGDVPVLMAHNTGNTPVLAMAGDVINGGKQDRVVTQDVLIEPSQRPQPLAVNCVEQSRWSQGGQGLSFSYAGRGEVELAKTLQTEKSQAQTWSKVAELNAKRGQAPSTGTYTASLGDDATKEKVDAAVKQLDDLGDAKAVGVVVAVNGKMKSAEIYDNNAIFAAARKGLVHSVVMDAAGQEALDSDAAAPSPSDAAAWVRTAREAAATETVEQADSDYVELESADTKNYELRRKDGKKLKTTIYAK
ncbi:MAG: hypothetical protein KTR31_22350 [Myxococcales bacterium]|nr:hypothetical protein [Myxococcales bacterium]